MRWNESAQSPCDRLFIVPKVMFLFVFYLTQLRKLVFLAQNVRIKYANAWIWMRQKSYERHLPGRYFLRFRIFFPSSEVWMKFAKMGDDENFNFWSLGRRFMHTRFAFIVSQRRKENDWHFRFSELAVSETVSENMIWMSDWREGILWAMQRIQQHHIKRSTLHTTYVSIFCAEQYHEQLVFFRCPSSARPIIHVLSCL